jgi:hypothetical protein
MEFPLIGNPPQLIKLFLGPGETIDGPTYVVVITKPFGKVVTPFPVSGLVKLTGIQS